MRLTLFSRAFNNPQTVSWLNGLYGSCIKYPALNFNTYYLQESVTHNTNLHNNSPIIVQAFKKVVRSTSTKSVVLQGRDALIRGINCSGTKIS